MPNQPADRARTDPGTFGEVMRDFLADVESRNRAAVEAVAERAVDCVRHDRLIHTFGTGHSSGIVQETFYRAGGLACVNAISHPMYIPLLGARLSTVAERTPGAATALAQAHDLRPGDLGVVFSTSGRNPGPVEMATAIHAAGMHVVGVGSREAAAGAPERAAGSLVAIADTYWDTGVPVGDAAFIVAGVRVAPLSSLASVLLWNLFLAELAARCAAAGIDLPVWQSSNAPGSDSSALHERYGRRIRAL